VGLQDVLLFQTVRRKDMRPIPPERYKEFYELRRPATDVRLWLGATQGGPAVQETSTEVSLKTANAEVPGFLTPLALGNLVIVCAGRTSDGPERLRVGSPQHTSATIQVWPASVRPVGWPPPTPLTDLSLERLVELL
jgi:hypothetical protein